MRKRRHKRGIVLTRAIADWKYGEGNPEKKQKDSRAKKSAGMDCVYTLQEKNISILAIFFLYQKKDHALLIGLPICWMIFAMMPTSAKKKCISL